MKNIKQFLYRYPFITYLLIVGVVFWPLSLGIYALQFDALDVFLPWRYFGSESIRQGIVPLWNPYQNGGYPFFADLQYSVWNPELFIVSLFGRYNATTIQLLYLFYLAVGGLGFRYLLIQFNLDKKVAFFGGVLFMLSGILIGHAQSIISILGAVWLPWAIGAYIAVLNRNFSVKSTIAVVLFLFLMLSSGYQAVSIMLFYLLFSFFIYRLIVIVRSKVYKTLTRFLIGHVIVGVLIGVLMLGVIFSLIDVFPHLSRLGGLSMEGTQRYIMHPKALLSVLFPLAAVQEIFPKMDVSFQNVFNGTLVIFLFIIGLKNYKKITSPYLIIMAFFGVIYGFASTGALTPVQPFLVNNLPGFDLFFYPVFYRYFTWLVLLIVACYGLQNFVLQQKHKQFLYFLIVSIVVYFFFAAFSYNSINAVFSKNYLDWIYTMRSFSFKEAILLESLLHLFIIGGFILAYFKIKKKEMLIFFFLIIELGLAAQLNIPITVHGEIKTASINSYIDSKREGFNVPNNAVSMVTYSENDGNCVLWRNQGNFTNCPDLNGFTSFWLNTRKNTKEEYPIVEDEIKSKPLFYSLNEYSSITVNSFTPNRFVLNVITEQKDSLIIQQAKYPGWKATVNGKEVEIFEANKFEMKIALPAGKNKIEFTFNKPLINFLFYVTHLGFIVLLASYFWISNNQLKNTLKYSGLGVVGLFVSFQLFSFYNTTQEPSEYRIEQNNKPLVTLTSNLSKMEKEKILSQLDNYKGTSISLVNKGLDFNPELIALLNYNYSKIETPISVNEGTIEFRKENDASATEIIELNNENRFADPQLLFDSENIYSKANIFTCGLTIHSEQVAKNIFVVVEIKRNGRTVLYKATPVHKLKSNNSAYFMEGFILPVIEKNDKLGIYLWNNSEEAFLFSEFKTNILSLKK